MIRKPEPEEGYWVGCSGSVECVASEEEATFEVQIVDDVTYLHCAKCGSVRAIEPYSKLYLSTTIK